jgi:hypothetical protein
MRFFFNRRNNSTPIKIIANRIIDTGEGVALVSKVAFKAAVATSLTTETGA